MQLGINGHLAGINYIGAREREAPGAQETSSWIASLAEAGREEARAEEQTAVVKTPGDRSEALKIYEAVKAGKGNPGDNIRQPAKVPYGYLAKDGIIEYNGVCFVCDEETNSICLGDVDSDPKKVIIVPLSGGGHLKVNRDNLGDLAKAVGMFSPEDLNRIMRAIAQDTKIQSMKQEIDDMEGHIGQEIGAQGAAKDDTEE